MANQQAKHHLQNTRVLVTGGAGFIGSHICEALVAQGCQVVIVDAFTDFYSRALKEENLRNLRQKIDANNTVGGGGVGGVGSGGGGGGGGVQLFEANITENEAIANIFSETQPEVVVHLAAWAGVRPSIERPGLYAEVNLGGTQVLLTEAARVGVSRFILASSSSVYGNNEKVPFAETDDVSNPISPYAATKISAELVCKVAAHLHPDLSITALRFFTVFGPRQRPDLAIQKFMQRISKGVPIPVFGNGAMSRDFTFVDDICAGVLRAVERCGTVAKYRCYNLGGEHPVTVRALISMIEEVAGKKAVIDWQAEQPGDVQQTWADLTRAKKELGYRPRTTIEAGLKAQWAWNSARESQ